MDDLIRRSALIKSFDPEHYFDWYTPSIIETINEQPTVDAVPVVRCKDCGLIQSCKNAQYLGLEGYCSNGDDGKKVQE